MTQALAGQTGLQSLHAVSMTHTDVIRPPPSSLPIPAPDGSHPHLASQTLPVNHQPSYAHITRLAKLRTLTICSVFTLFYEFA